MNGGASRGKQSLARSAREAERHVTPSGPYTLFTRRLVCIRKNS
jgi:hypothetical protein